MARQITPPTKRARRARNRLAVMARIPSPTSITSTPIPTLIRVSRLEYPPGAADHARGCALQPAVAEGRERDRLPSCSESAPTHASLGGDESDRTSEGHPESPYSVTGPCA